ncbi:MAG: NAD-dependent epimerase/dehydratase family protein [Solirubrobacterales bacterium]|nr:NAD-dependent epimerase/dehydratase family protein [Solirubrobacterales bacterium]
MILLTGATGLIGGELLPLLLASGEEVRVLVREPRRLGPNRVNVQISLGDLADARSARHAMRGVDTVIHLAASIRDQPSGSVEELNGLATVRLLRAAERAGAKRFLFFSALNASDFQRTRFFRAKALAERVVLASPLRTTVFAPSIVYGPGDPWVTLLRRFSKLPAVPVVGDGEARYQPIWAADVARCVTAALEGKGPAAKKGEGARYELAGPQTLSYDEIVEEVLGSLHRDRPLLHVPLPLVKTSLRIAELIAGPAVFATWEEAELMEVPMTTQRGTVDPERLGVAPCSMAEVLGR